MKSSINRVHIPNAVGYHTDDNKFVLTEDLVIKFDGLTFRIKRGYKNDGVSNPLGGRFNSKALSPAIFHDVMTQAELYSNSVTNNNFLFLMRKNGVRWITRVAYFVTVTFTLPIVKFNHTVGSVENARQYLEIKKI